MSISKREGSPFYWYDFTVKGSRFRGSTETSDKQLATAIEIRLRDENLRQGYLGDLPTLTLDQACGKFLNDHARYLKSGKVCLVHYCAHLIRLIGESTPFNAINDAAVAAYVSARRKENARNKTEPVSNTTVNREIETLSNIHNKMKQWGYHVGAITFKNHKLPQTAHRLRWLRPEEAKRLIDACGTDYLRQIVTFALLTGLRRENILSLERQDIDLFAGTIPMRVKSRKPGGKPHSLPITSAMRVFLEKEMGWLPGQTGPLFVKKGGGRYHDVKSGFSAACKKAGIKQFRFHDLRHTCASWLVQNGVPLATVKEILGHEHITTTMRYAHLHSEAKRDGLETIASQMRHTGPSTHKRKKARISK